MRLALYAPNRSICGVLIGLALAVPLTPSQSEAWSGTILDKESRQPIDGAVITRTWTRTYATVAGANYRGIGSSEAISDARGRFTAFRMFFLPGIPFFTHTYENPTLIYKPGYKFLVIEDHPSVVELERLPTRKRLRQLELDKAKEQHFQYATSAFEQWAWLPSAIANPIPVFKTAIEHEEEFISERVMPPHPVLVLGPMVMQRAQTDTMAVIGVDKRGPVMHSPVKINPNPPQTWKDIIRNSNQKSDDEWLRIIADPSQLDAHYMAAIQLGYSNDPRVMDALGRLFTDTSLDDSVRSSAANALEQINNPNKIEFYLKALNDPDKGIKYSAVSGLKTTPDPRAIDPMIALLNSNDHNLSGRAFEVLVKIGSPAVSALLRVLEQGDAKSRNEAAQILGQIADPRAINPLIAQLNKQEAGVSYSAAGALGHFQDRNAAHALAAALAFHDDYLRSSASSALYHMGQVAVDDLIANAAHPDHRVRLYVASDLDKYSGQKVVETLLELINDHHHEVRLAAIKSLSRQQSPLIIEPLLTLWHDDDKDIRMATAVALVDLNPPPVAALTARLKDHDPYIRWRAVAVLGIIKDPSSVEPIIKALTDPATEVRWAAITALGEMNTRSAVERLAPLCRDEDTGLEEAAEAALLKITGEPSCGRPETTAPQH
jgi:HEAT repeat protein